jgi:hypothetical protein
MADIINLFDIEGGLLEAAAPNAALLSPCFDLCIGMYYAALYPRQGHAPQGVVHLNLISEN